ncbi:hypothetical protein E2C01_000858 [Portunus trituberculatus]|uniref:Uncharacterized protein n=1 Tax=Portunus trituberculatus TaxID=210409 RepID=A0A5B7CFR3_PORTR|nr:hypothetical protein [Portunus trituberculatus]
MKSCKFTPEFSSTFVRGSAFTPAAVAIHKSYISYTFPRYIIPAHSVGRCEPLARRVCTDSQYGRPHSEGKTWYGPERPRSPASPVLLCQGSENLLCQHTFASKKAEVKWRPHTEPQFILLHFSTLRLDFQCLESAPRCAWSSGRCSFASLTLLSWLHPTPFPH